MTAETIPRRTFTHLVDPEALGARARAGRWSTFLDTFPDLPRLRVLDLGGRAGCWPTDGVRPAAVTLLNLEPPLPAPPWVTHVVGDACDPPAEILAGSYDLVFSQSLIEHLGGPARRQQFADVVHALAPRHWVQTPYRYFPVEPHWLFPGMQFLPLAARAALSARWPLGHLRPLSSTHDAAVATALSVDLLTVTELRTLFPDGYVWPERFGPLVKSITAVRTG